MYTSYKQRIYKWAHVQGRYLNGGLWWKKNKAESKGSLGEGSMGSATGGHLTQPNLTFFSNYRKPTNGTTTTSS